MDKICKKCGGSFVFSKNCPMCGGDSVNSIELATHRQSNLTVILGIIAVFSGIVLLFTMMYMWWIGLFTMLFGFSFISLGNRQVIDQDYFTIFLKEFIKINKT